MIETKYEDGIFEIYQDGELICYTNDLNLFVSVLSSFFCKEKINLLKEIYNSKNKIIDDIIDTHLKGVDENIIEIAECVSELTINKIYENKLAEIKNEL